MTLENQPSKKKRKKGLIIGLIAAGAFAVSIGGVFAANSITINGGSAIEFGQGLSNTGTCDAALTTTINQAYNSSTSKFEASTVVVSGIKDYDCDGKTLHVSLLGSSGTVCSVDGTHTSGANQDSFTITDGGTSGSNDDQTKTVTIASGCDATTITKVAITTS
jgi:hypothetical protein